jgi:hypothetical protein
MSRDPEPTATRFEPLHPASRSRLVVAFVVGPLMWLVALVVALVLIERTDAIELGLLIAFGSFVVAAIGLLAFYAARRRQELRERAR